MIKVALLGFGRIGQMHAENINKNKDLKLLYVYEKDDLLCKKAKKLYNCKIEKNYNKIFQDNNVDIIFISSPTNTHIKFIEESMEFKKTIFCEKPLDLDIIKILKVLKKVKKIKPKIQLGFNRRYDPGHFSIKKDLDKNKIGKLEKVIITSRDPAPPTISYLKSSGGIFRDMMIHDFDLCRMYLGNDEISEVNAVTSSFEKLYKKIKDHELAVVTMKSKKGVICVITNSRHCSFGYDQRVELFGKKGMLLSGNKEINSTELFNSNLSSSKKPFLNFFIDRYKDAYNLQLKELTALHKGKIKSRSTFEDGYMALKLANACYKSLRLKKTIKI
jgi:myo-inositol 2-dehydrogenase / D-chiro-inositol 1-dehydrogenase